MKKVLSMLLVLLVLLCALVACNNEESSSSSQQQSQSQSQSQNQNQSESESEKPEPTSSLTYKIGEDGYIVTGCSRSNISQIVIPSTYNGKSVVEIGDGAFENLSSLETVIIPDTVKAIYFATFRNCTNLKTVVIPDSVTWLGECVFKGCESLTSVTIGKGVSSIMNSAFENCASLETINIPNSVTDIDSNAFDGCSSLKYNEYDNGYYLGNEENPYLCLFKPKSNDITSCVIHEQTKNICSLAECTSLESLTIPASVTKIDYSAFDKSKAIKTVNYLGTIEQWCNIPFEGGSSGNPLSNGAQLYLNGILVEDLVIPNTVKEIKQFVFYGASFKSVTIPSTVTTIDEYAFGSGRSVALKLEDFSIEAYFKIMPNLPSHNSIEFLENGETLKNIVIPEGVTSIPDNAFTGWTEIESITIPSTVTYIGKYAFSGCTGVKALYFNATEFRADDYYNGSYSYDSYTTCLPFKNMGADSGGFHLIVGKTVKSIPDEFMYCSSDDYYPRILTVVFEEDSVCKSIGASAFYNCKVLKTVVLPDSVKTIKSGSFKYCSRLKTLYLGSGLTDIASGAFYSTGNGVAYYNGTASDWNNNVVNDGLGWSNIFPGEQPKGAFVVPNTKIKKGLFMAGGIDSVACLGSSYIVEDYENVEKYIITVDIIDTKGNLKYKKIYEMESSDSSPNIMCSLGLSLLSLDDYTVMVSQIQIQYKDGTSEYTLTDYSTTVSTGVSFSSGTPVNPTSSTMYTN